MTADFGRWETIEPGEAARLLAGTDVPWWIAGGWAVELFVGRRTRPQEDLDLGVWREEVAAFTAALPQHEFHVAKDGALTPIAAGAPLRSDAHILWGRRPGRPWTLEVLVEDRAGDEWTYRRDRRVRRPAASIVRACGGLPVIGPAVQLLYKSKDVRPKDQADFDVVAPLLSDDERTWLADALALAAPGHPWAAQPGPLRRG